MELLSLVWLKGSVLTANKSVLRDIFGFMKVVGDGEGLGCGVGAVLVVGVGVELVVGVGVEGILGAQVAADIVVDVVVGRVGRDSQTGIEGVIFPM